MLKDDAPDDLYLRIQAVVLTGQAASLSYGNADNTKSKANS